MNFSENHAMESSIDTTKFSKTAISVRFFGHFGLALDHFRQST